LQRICRENMGSSAFHTFLSNAGPAGRMILQFDWSNTSLGRMDAWPESLRSILRTALMSRQPMNFYWGPDLLQFFNEAYIPMLGDRVEGAIGAPFKVFWAEVFEDVRPYMEAALRGEGTWIEDFPLIMTRHGVTEETYWTFSYSPIFDSDESISGFMNIVSETTQRVRAERNAKTTLDRVTEIFQQSPAFIAILRGPQHLIQYVNPAFRSLLDGRDVSGMTVAEAMTETVAKPYVEALDSVFASGNPHKAGSSRYVVSDAEKTSEHYVDFVYQPIRAQDGTISGVLVEGFDVTDRVEAVRELKASDSFLRSIMQSSGDCIKVLDLKGNLTFMSEGGMKLMEIDDFESVNGCPWPNFWQQEGNLAARIAIDEASKGIVGSFQGYADTQKGNSRYWDVQVTPIFDQDGKPERILAVSRDISSIKKSELLRVELNQEMAHRLKNTLAMVQAIVRQTFRQAETVEEGRDAILGRIVALARAQDILTATEWSNANINSVIASALAPHKSAEERFAIDGPDVELSQQQSLGLSLLLHELATNAAKYGALRNAEGRVHINWSVAPDSAFSFRWVETGGPTVATTRRKGFGSRLIERMVAPYFNGDATLSLDPMGARFHLNGQIGNNDSA
jgi:PAS domain S-box-containing protein